MTRPAISPNPEPLYDGVDEFVALLGQLANAQGCGLYEPRHGRQTLVRRAAAGLQPPDLEELGYNDLDHLELRKQWATLPLYSDGLISAVLILVFASEAEKQEAKSVLKRIVPLFESLARFVSEQTRQVKLASKISELETGIAAEKILDRARGLLREHPHLNESTIEQVDRHVAKVLASCQFSQVLQDRLRELEGLAAERDVTSRAKTVLQEQFGFSEEKAYLHLRTLSRQRRKRISEIAQEIVDGKQGATPTPTQPQREQKH
ncbi:MAG: ANTAR domain-containing protein [Acidobacteriota bacterium]